MIRATVRIFLCAVLVARSLAASCELSPFGDLESTWDGIDGRSSYVLADSEEGTLLATIQTHLELDLTPGDLCIATVFETYDGLIVAEQERIELTRSRISSKVLRSATVELPDSLDQLLVIVEQIANGTRAVFFVDEAETDHLAPPANAQHANDRSSWSAVEGGRPSRSSSLTRATDRPGTVVRIVPPPEPASGSTLIRILSAHRDVARVSLSVDGETPLVQGRKPYSFRIRLPSPSREHHLEAVAYDAGGHVLGIDQRFVNRFDQPFRARITSIDGDPGSGSITLSAVIDVPTSATLRTVEIYRNQELLHQTTDSRIEVVIETPELGPDDYLRVAAILDDGSSIDDVALLSTPLEPEQVDVNLVSFHVVAVDSLGSPIRDLTKKDFRVFETGRQSTSYPIDEVAFADDVPLRLGTIVDTSGSMQLVMADTKKAAAKFLGTTVRARDQAFLVDFADQPRLLHPTSHDIPSILIKLQTLQPSGTTAMYDAIVFSMLQFEDPGGRRALVVLTDGDDRDSRFGPKKCVELGREQGVPIYIIALGELDTFQRSYRKSDLRQVTRETGGRLFFVDSLGELDQAYATINAELRSQYTIRFYSERDLSADERQATRVAVDREGVTVRVVPAPIRKH